MRSMSRLPLLLLVITIVTLFDISIATQDAPVSELSTRIWKAPPPFRDEFLASVPPNGQDMDHLGRIVRLSKLFSGRQVGSKFSIYTRRGSAEDIVYDPEKKCEPELIKSCDEVYQFQLGKMVLSGFDPNLRTIILVPGFLTNDKPEWILESKDLWLQLEDCNVIMVTWKDGNRTIYHMAVANTPVVARQISVFLYYLAGLNDVNFRDPEFLGKIQIVGHSLGAHISGFVGKDFGGQISRITGLDPAGPSFERKTRRNRLDRYDAKLVTVIHSNRGELVEGLKRFISRKIGSDDKMEAENQLEDGEEENVKEKEVPSYFGINEQLGDIDYFANDGRLQPGCNDPLHICDHGRSTTIYKQILAHQLRSRLMAQNDRIKEEQNRLLAFRTNGDYDTFLTGINFNDQCPNLFEESKVAGSHNHVRNCAIPIDVIGQVDNLIYEFQHEYGIDFNKSQYPESNRFFFKTLAQDPFVGEHYLLKVRLSKKESVWGDTCKLKGYIKMANGAVVELEVNRGSNLIDTQQFFGLAMPYVNPLGIDATQALDTISDQLNRALLDQNQAASHHEISNEELSKVVPSELELSIVSDSYDSSATSGTAKLQLLKSMSEPAIKRIHDRHIPNVEQCKLVIVSTEVVPISVKSKANNLVGLYDDPGKETNVGNGVNWALSSAPKINQASRSRSRRVLSNLKSFVKHTHNSGKFTSLLQRASNILSSNSVTKVIRKFARLVLRH